jgi:alpha-L-fucosidase
MKWLCNSLAIGATFTAFSVPLLGYQNFVEVKPSPQQVAWQDLEFGVIVHFSTNTFLDREWGDGTASPAVFNPTQFDPDQWMQAIKASGAKYIVLVAKHHDGFCLWPTEQTDYSVKASPWKDGKGDLVGDVARSARKYGPQSLNGYLVREAFKRTRNVLSVRCRYLGICYPSVGAAC